MRHIIDKRRHNGRFVLLGSCGPILLRKVSETLAGRIGIRVPATRLLRFWTLLVHVHGQLLNVSMLAKSLELSTTAISNYLDILEGVLLIRRLRPYHVNIRKRLVKSPKVYIRDSGILHRLADLAGESSLETWPNRDNSFEGLVLEELITAATNSMNGARFTFYRTQAGAEVNLLVHSGQRIWPIEIKLGIDVRHYDTVGLRHCMEDLELERGFIITRGDSIRSLGRGIYTLPWEKIASGQRYPWSERPLGAR